jgi:hypothetical protein
MSDIPNPPPGGEEPDLEIEDDVEIGSPGEGEDTGEDGEGPGGEAGEAGESAGDEGEVEPEPRPRQGRKSEAQRWRDRAERAEREAAEARGYRQATEQFGAYRQPQGPSPAELERQQQQEAERLSMLSPQEVSAYYYNKGRQELQQTLLMQQLQTEDRIDKRDFDQQARSSRVHGQYKDAVERELVQERNRGNLRVTREDILHRLVGRDAVDRAARAAPAQRRAAQSRVASQQTRPTGARGDGAAGARGKPGDPAYDEALAIEGMRKGYF